MANTWKHLSKLSTDFHMVYHSISQQDHMEVNDTQDDLLDWVTFCIQNICELITANVQKMLEVRDFSLSKLFKCRKY